MLEVQIAQDSIFSEQFDLVISATGGTVSPVSPEWATRLRAFRNGGVLPMEPSDLPMIASGVVRFAAQEEAARSQIEASMLSYLSSKGAMAIMPTEKCNFRCRYCYETFAKGRMPESVFLATMNFLDEEVPRFSSYDLSWFGGEPLLQLDLVERGSLHFQHLLKKYERSGSVSITTNGSRLSIDAVRRLHKAGMNQYQITLDGPQELHDQQRPRQDGSSTYSDVLTAIKNVINESDASVTIRFNYKPTRPQVVAEIKEWLRSDLGDLLGRDDGRVSVHGVPIWDATTTGVSGICLTEPAMIDQVMAMSHAVSEAQSLDYAAQTAKTFSQVGSLACYAGKPGHYVIGSDGTIYKCTVAFDLPENHIGSVLHGRTARVDKNREDVWTADNAISDSGCGKCSISRACLGIHCPLTRMQERRRPCPTAKLGIGRSSFWGTRFDGEGMRDELAMS